MSSEGPRRGLMLVISSPSGAGKTSLSRQLVTDQLLQGPVDTPVTTVRTSGTPGTWIPFGP